MRNMRGTGQQPKPGEHGPRVDSEWESDRLHANKPLPVQECKGALLCLTSCEVYCTVYTVWAFTTDEDDYDSVRDASSVVSGG
jgi:hypothetical protein